MKASPDNPEFEKFDNAMRKILTVSHEEATEAREAVEERQRLQRRPRKIKSEKL
jgi:hypothetical protein